MCQTVEKYPTLQCWKILQKFLDPALDTDEFQNSVVPTLPKGNICGKSFTRIRLVVIRELANRETHRQQIKYHLVETVVHVTYN